MKRRLLLAVIAGVMLAGCSPSAKQDQDYSIRVIDSCEYIEVKGSQYSLTHKGNCNNSVHNTFTLRHPDCPEAETKVDRQK
jgi:hypothetical protein